MSSVTFAEPPRHLVADSGAEVVFCTLMALVVTGGVLYALRRREPLLIVLLAAAAVSSFIEPFYDYAGRAWWATNLTTSFVSFDGRLFSPFFFPLGYAVWVGIGAYVAYRLFVAKSPTRTQLVRGFALLAVAESVLELPWIHTHLFAYYGHQPYRIFGYSLVWCAINTSGLAFNATVLLWLRDRRDGRGLQGRGVLAAALVPFLDIGWYFGVAWPLWFGYQTSASTFVLWILGTVVIGVACAEVWALCTWVGRRSARVAPAVAVPAVAARPVAPSPEPALR